MAQYEHLSLRRLEGELPRRKRGGGRPPARNPKEHGPTIQAELDSVVAAQEQRIQNEEIDPALILKIQTAGPVDQEDWNRIGLTVLATDPNSSLILFGTDNELQEFRKRVAAYQRDPPEGQIGPEFAGFVNAIEKVGEVSPNDRLGPTLLQAGIASIDDFDEERSTILDLELWNPGAEFADRFVYRITQKLAELGGRRVSEYRGNTTTLVRIEANGRTIRKLLEMSEIAKADLPPETDFPPVEVGEFNLHEVGEIIAPNDGAGAIGIVDSGIISAHPLLEKAVIGAFGMPEQLGDDDEKGHGTPVSGVAIYGDIKQLLAGRSLTARFRIASAKVVNREGRFDNTELVPKQMEDAIRKLYADYGCRVINISLADAKRRASSKPSAWTAVLDGLARELDLVIVVSTGNADRNFISGYGDGIAAAYPKYMFEKENRILEPGSGINVITVGSIAHSNGLDAEDANYVGVLPLTQSGQPSPFTRTGPGAAGILKPDFVEYGGTAVFDGPTQQLVDGSRKAAAGILTLHNRYLERLIATRSGTSFATPLVAYKAALVREAFPQATANLVRAVLAISADWPESAVACLTQYDYDSKRKILGNGLIDIERALYSDDNRVVLIREDTLGVDQFAVFEIPIPEDFQTTEGTRQIRVALAYDPPVRHTRLDYAGTSMGFNLIRGSTEEDVFSAFRKWAKKDGQAFKLHPRLKCDMLPKQTIREQSALQLATFEAKRNISKYGDKYYLVVRCEGGWAAEARQRFAVAVEMRHQAEIKLYAQLRVRVRA